MKQHYFLRNGQKYDTGTMIRIKQFNYVTGKLYEIDAKFISYDFENNKYELEINNIIKKYSKNDFDRMLCGIVVENNNEYRSYQLVQRNKTFKDELDVDGLLFAWMWYIFIMAIATIFYERIGIWILASIIFFNYRNKKLKEAGYK